MHRLIGVALLVLLAGCQTIPKEDQLTLASFFEDRKWRGCYEVVLSGGAGFGGAISGSFSGVVVTGDEMTIEQCMKALGKYLGGGGEEEE